MINAISKLFQMLCTCVVLAVIATAALFTFVEPPPSSAPTAGTIQWDDDATTSDKAVAIPLLAMSSWEVRTLGPISFAKGDVPFTDKDLNLVGVAGRWYVASK